MLSIGMGAGRRVLGTLSLAAVVAGSGPLWAGSVTRISDDTVNVKALRVPLGQLLRELAAVTPIPNLVIDPKLEQQLVSSYLERTSVTEAVRKTLDESGIQYLLWGGGAEPLGLFAGDLRKAGLASPGSKPSSADLAAMTREERRAARDQMRGARAEAPVVEAVSPVEAPPDELPADSFAGLTVPGASGASASVDIGGTGGVPMSAGGAANGATTADGAAAGAGTGTGAGQALPGMPPPIRGTANWVGEDGQTHTSGYTMQGESVVYDNPNFVTFKNSPEARAKRMNMDVSTLP